MKKHTLILSLLFISFVSLKTEAARIYVDYSASGTNTGATWTNAYTSLQSAVASAASGDEVWVAAGTYKPSAYPVGRTSSDVREYAFYLESGVDYYGGFDGTETTLAARDYTTNVTILSGDIGTTGTTSDNCYHVLVSINESTTHTLDGFTVTKGKANGGTNATINGQAGIWANNGGAMYSYVSNMTISNCIFEDNYGQYGGAIKDIGSPIAFTNTVFANNEAFNHGGAFDKTYGNTTSFVNCVFYNNTANRTSSTMGGALQLQTCTSGTTITNCTFFNNKAGQGGAIRAYDSPVTAKNTIFYDNYDNGSKTAAGSDIWDAGASTSFNMTNCQMQLSSSSYTAGNSNALTSATNTIYNQDPLFVNSSDPDGADNVWMTKDDGLKLKSTSPAVDAGLNSAISGYSTDIVGTTRVVNTTVNMGAYELLACLQANSLPSSAATYTATYADTDGNYTCYCDDNSKLILGLNLNSTGAVVPTTGVSLEIGASTTTNYTNAGGIITNTNGGVIFNRKWNVTPTTAPTSDVTVLYPFTNTEYSAIVTALSSRSTTVTNANQLQMYKLTSSGTFADPHASGAAGVILAHGASASTGIWVHSTHNNGTDHLATYKVASFSGGGGGGGASGNPLPVELIHFTAQAAHTTAELTWATATEIDNSHFAVERSYDARSFAAIDRVEGNSNSNEVLNYNYTDTHIAKGTKLVYYRLHQFDYNGASEYSDVRKVIFEMDNLDGQNMAIYPNPFTSDVYIDLSTISGAAATIQVINIAGQQLIKRSISEPQQIEKVDLSSLPKGIYFVKVTTANSASIVKVIKR